MRFSKIVKLFKKGNVCVCGLRGKGKDLLMSNVVSRRKLPYVSNVPYGGSCYPWSYEDFDVGTYKELVTGCVKYYSYPYPDHTDLYLSDAGIYFPSQYCNELNKDFKGLPTFMALSRHLGKCNVHVNVQNLNRCWDKIREQSDTYIRCDWCTVLFGKIVLQHVVIYDQYEACLQRVKPFKSSSSILDRNVSKTMIKLEKDKFERTFGSVKGHWLIYWHKGDYDTYFFKGVFDNEENFKN